MKRTDLAYAAGIIDGEGCISISRNSKNRGLQIQVEVGNTNEWLLQWLRFAFGGRVILVNDRRTENRGWKPVYHWYLRYDEIREFLKLIYPYLRIKRVQAEIVLKVLGIKDKKFKHLSEEEQAIIEAQRILMGNLNKTKIKI